MFLRLSWVRDFYIGFDSKEKSWKIYITHGQNQEPSMNELKEIWGDSIYRFVDFIKEQVNEYKQSDFLRGPRSGDAFDNENCRGTISILGVGDPRTIKHYAITCYHVCFNEYLPQDCLEAHKILKDDYKRGSPKCTSVTYDFTDEDSRRSLGTFYCGLYDDKHDIALVELHQYLSCTDAITFLNENDVENALASEQEVIEKFKDMDGSIAVEKFGSTTGISIGELFSVDGGSWLNGMNRDGYRIREMGSKKKFAKKGDSGSLVCMVCKDGKKIPFAYLNLIHSGVYYCINLKSSLEALNADIKPCLGECGFLL